jgi:hypothetical protein
MNGYNLTPFKNLATILTICIFTLVLSWFSVFKLLNVFIDIAPYAVGKSFYISEILLTFILYFLGSLLAIKNTRLHPFIAAIPVGITGLIFYCI